MCLEGQSPGSVTWGKSAGRVKKLTSWSAGPAPSGIWMTPAFPEFVDDDEDAIFASCAVRAIAWR